METSERAARLADSHPVIPPGHTDETMRTPPGTSRRNAVLILMLCLTLAAQSATAAPEEIIPLNPAAPNYATIFPTGVLVGNSTPQAESFKAGDEILLAAYAYLAPTSPVAGDTAYRDRLLVLLDDRFARWAAGDELADIGWSWQAAYAYFLLKTHSPSDLSPARVTLYEEAILRNQTHILDGNPLLYDQGILANLWLNGDIRQAKSVYFGALARGDATNAEKARKAIDTVMTQSVLGDGGTRYVGFWSEVASYHDDSIRNLLWWWLITGSPCAKAAVDATLRYTVVTTEPDGFTEQSSNIPYKHMYNNHNTRRSALWKAYLYDDGYNYFFGQSEETATSKELLNTILYQPSRRTKSPPTNAGAFFDSNFRGPRGRFGGTWGWIAHGRDVQRGGPENADLIAAQGYAGRQCGKATFVGAFALGALANKTSLKGALDTVLLEFKESAGPETDLMRGNTYRYLSQDEQTRTITRKKFGTLSTSYRISRRTSSLATPTWSNSATPWLGQQLWVLTGERMIGLIQMVSDGPSTVYGLDTRLVFTGGRKNIMGSFLDLTQPEATGFAFGDLRAKIHLTTFTGNITQERIAISDPASTDDFSALIRIHDAATPADDSPVDFPSGTRRWMVLDVTRDGQQFVTPVYNVLANNNTWAVLQFHEAGRKVRIVQNLTSTARIYTGNFVVGSTYATTSLHRSWSDTVTSLNASSGTAVVTDTVPAYGHMIAVSSNQPDDHTTSFQTSAEVYGADAYRNELLSYSLGGATPQFSLTESGTSFTFPRLRSDVNYLVQSSPDLATWSTIAQNPGSVGETVSVLSPPAPTPPGRQFFHLLLQPQ